MCDFCNLEINKFSRLEKGVDYAPSVYIEKYKNKCFLIASGDAETKFQIVCCPKCGEKL